MSKRFKYVSEFEKDGKQLANTLQLADRGSYIQMWIDNKNAGYAGIRINMKDKQQLIDWLNSVGISLMRLS